MKAKEYAERYKTCQDHNKELGKIAFEFLMETKTLMEQRHARSNAAMFAILSEIDAKWRAFTRLAEDPDIRADGFRLLVQRRFPDVYPYWIAYREGG